MVTRVLFGLLTILTLGGAAVAAIGMRRSWELTGDWIGYGIPNAIAAMIGIGILSFAFGLICLVAACVIVVARRTGLMGKLHTSVLEESHPAAQAGRVILRVKAVWDAAVLIFVLGVVTAAAFTDGLVAAILGATALLMGLLYWFLRDRA